MYNGDLSVADAKLSFNGSAVETKSVGGGDVRMKLVRDEFRIETDATLNGQTVEVIVFEDTNGNGSYDNYQVVSVGDGTNSYTLNQLSGSGSDYWLRWDFSTSDLTKAASVNYGDVDNGVGKWDSSGEWDSARSSSGVVHKSLSNTDFGDGSVVNHALPVGSTQNITNGLVGWWPLHTTSGKAPDLSGNGNHGTHNGTTRGVAGKGGLQATSFNSGTADNVDLGASFGDSLFQNGNFTLTVWSRLRSTGRRNIVNYSNDVLSIGYENQGSNGHEASIYDGSFNIVTSGNTTTGEWLFHTLRYDSSATELEYLIDAVSQGTVSAGTPSETDETFRIGNLHFEDRAWDGPIFDFRAYNRLLSDNEIQTLYNWGSTTGVTDPRLHNGSDSGAVTRYALDGDATDSWGSNDGTNNGVSFVNDSIRGQAGKFQSGNNDYIEVNNPSGLPTGDTSMTLSVWAKETQSNPSFAAWGSASTGDAFGCFVSSDLVIVQGWGSSKDWETNYEFNYGSWVHLVATYDGSETRLYANGVLEDSTTSYTFSPTDNKIIIGAELDENSDFVEGLIDDVRIYARKLEPWEIQQLYLWGTRGRDMRPMVVQA